MKILYGVNGEGLGHYNRYVIVKSILEKFGHEVKLASYGDCKNPDIKIHGIKLDISNGVNIFKAIDDFLRLDKNQKIGYSPDLVITDYEPVCANFARKNKIPLISIDNQHRFDTIDYSLPPSALLYNIALKIFNTIFIGKVDESIVSCFYKTSKSIPPILDPMLISLRESPFDVVYLKGEYLSKFLSNKSDRPQFIFGGAKFSPARNRIPLDSRYFKNYLISCDRVISNAGHQLISECIHLKKEHIIIPIKNQPEQMINFIKRNDKRTKIATFDNNQELIQRLKKWM